MAGVSSRPAVLVGVLHVDEPSLPRVRERILAQVDVDVTLVEVANLPERAAHARLYELFSTAGPEHDALVKVDADMELVEPRLLAALGSLFRRHRGLDHVIVGVDDWFSGRRIQGMNAWRNGVRWTAPPPELFTDLPDNTVRTKLKVMDVGRPLVLHAADPSDLQAVRYGLHRGLKAVATGKASRLSRLVDVVDHAAAEPARGRLLAVAAIGLALRDDGAARTLLDATQHDATPSGTAGVATLSDEVADPDLCGRVRRDLTALTADAGSGPLATARTQPRGRARAVRGRIARALRRDGVADTSDRDRWRDDFLALLDGG